MSGNAPILVSVLCASVWFAAAAGCASDADTPADDVPRKQSVRGAEQGLEVVWWPVDDSTGALSRALAAYMDRPTAISATRLRALRTNGLRAVSVPMSEVDGLRQSLRLVGPVQSQWFGQLPRWTPIISGPSWEGVRLIELDQPEHPRVHPKDEPLEPIDAPEGLLRLGPGRLRLLARCWIEPSLTPAPGSIAEDELPAGAERAPPSLDQSSIHAVLQLEVVVQHEEREDRAATMATAAPETQKAKGLLFDRLMLSTRCDGENAILIVPDTPGARWRSTEELSNDAPGMPALPPPFRGVDRPPTLGEAMLTDAAMGGFARTKIVVVLVARVPDEYTLLR